VTRVRQRGVALVTALLVVAIASVAAIAMANRQQLDIRRTGSLLHGEQAWAYVMGAENWAVVVLRRDREDSEVDTLGEDWSTQPPVSFVEGGSIIGRLIDVQGRFNVNNLVSGGTASAENIEFYKRLLRLLDLEEALADVLVDWIDDDIDVRFPDGAEDDGYLLLETPYRVANRPLADISELRLVQGYTAEVVTKLLPYLVALPEPTPVNVNTADAVVLAALADNLGISDGESLVEGRGEKGYETVDEFKQEAALNARQIDDSLLSVRTQWFLMVSQADIGQGRARLASLIQRTDDELRIVRRQREFNDTVTAPADDDE
jgi:general secretion pathway protein K